MAALNWPLQPKKIQQNRAFAKYRKIPMELSFIIYSTPYMYTEFSFRSNIVSATPDLCLEDLTIEQMSWYGWENLYSGFKNDALFGYLTYLCFLLSRQKSSLSNVGGCREVQVCSLSSVRSHLCDSISPSVKWGQLLSRCWTSRKGGRSAVSESWFWKWLLALLWCGKMMFEEPLLSKALGESICVKYI